MTPPLMKKSTKALLSVTSKKFLEKKDSRTVPLFQMKLLNQNGNRGKLEKKKIIYKMWKKYNKLFLH